MSSPKRFALPPVPLTELYLHEALRCLLHTVLFNRALGVVRPEDVESERLGVTWVQCGDAAVAASIEACVADLQQRLAWPADEPGRAEVTVQFYELVVTPGLIYGESKSKVAWETWVLRFDLRPQTTELRPEHVAQALRHSALEILRHVD